MSTTVPHVSLADIREARRAPRGRGGRDRRWRSRAGCPRSSAARCCSSARTSSAPARSRSAAPTCGSPALRGGARPRRGRGVRRQPRAGRRARRPAARHQGHGVHARGRADPQGERDPGVRRRGGLPRRATSTTSLEAAMRFADETGAVLIHPFDHVDIVAGQGTCGLEILEQAPDVETVLVPDRRRRPAGRHRHRDQGASSARRPGDRGPGRGRGGVPDLAGDGPPGRR